MTAPERIALRWEVGAAVTSGPLMDHPDYTQYIRADLVATPAPEVAALVEAAQEYIEELEWHYGGGTTDLTRKYRAALAALRGNGADA